MAPRKTPNRTAGARKASAPTKRTGASRGGTASPAEKPTKANGTNRPTAKAATAKRPNGSGTTRPAPKAAPPSAAVKKANGNGNGKPRRISTASEPAGVNKSGLPKLGKGALETQVLDHMAAHAKVEFSPAELANKLSRSSGAIANALAKFAEQGLVIQTSQRPRRYRFAGARSARRANGAKRR